MITAAGAEYILKVNFGMAAQIDHWYIGLVTNYDPNVGWTEFVDYTGDRPRWIVDGPDIVHGNTLSGLTFNSNANINGMFLTNISAKGDLSGLIFSIGKTVYAQEVRAGQIFTLDYTAAWP